MLVAKDATSGKGCLTPESDVVPAGGHWSFEAVYLYCRDITEKRPLPVGTAYVEVVYTDDDGVAAVVRGTTATPPSHP